MRLKKSGGKKNNLSVTIDERVDVVKNKIRH